MATGVPMAGVIPTITIDGSYVAHRDGTAPSGVPMNGVISTFPVNGVVQVGQQSESGLIQHGVSMFGVISTLL